MQRERPPDTKGKQNPKKLKSEKPKKKKIEGGIQGGLPSPICRGKMDVGCVCSVNALVTRRGFKTRKKLKSGKLKKKKSKGISKENMCQVRVQHERPPDTRRGIKTRKV